MGKYGDSAVLAARLYKEQKALTPVKAWEMAVAAVFPFSQSSQVKGCPRNAFLGLCENGSILGIPVGSYCRSVQNKRYALRAIELIKEHPSLLSDQKTLWQQVMKTEGSLDKAPNHQMDVVISLWHAGHICE